MDCERLQAFADGELPDAEVPAFQAHLAACQTCQSELREVMLLEALWLGLAQRKRSSWTHAAVATVATAVAPPPSAREGARPRPAAWARRAALAGAAAAVLLPLTLRRTGAGVDAAADGRPLAARMVPGLAYPDRPWRPGRDARCPVAAAGLPVPGDQPELVAACLRAGAADQTSRAVLAMQRGDWHQARSLLLAVLAATPGYPEARWNLALVYEKTGERAAAAATLAGPAKDGEAGLSVDSAERARAARGWPVATP
jgi:hypothetical protein